MKRLISLLAALPAVIMWATPGLAQSPTYSWVISCNKTDTPGISSGVSWYWLNDGRQIRPADPAVDGFVGCASSAHSGTVVIPNVIVDQSGASREVNGIGVDTYIQTGCCGCGAGSTITKSFDPSAPNFAITDNASPPVNVRDKVFGGKVICPNANASLKFNIHSN